MKSLSLLSAALLVTMTTPAFAKGGVVAKCSNGEEIQLVIRQTDADTYSASVITQSFGDSYPEFHFKNLTRRSPSVPHRMGAPMVIEGKGFEVSMNFSIFKAPADLTIPSLGLHHEQLNCR